MNRTVDKSIQMRERAARVIPGVAQTLAKGPSQFAQGVAPVFLQSGKGCRDTDVDGNQVFFKSAGYPVAKAGVVHLSKYCAAYWGHDRVRGNVLCPGGVFDDQEPGFAKRYARRTPMGRMAEPTDYNGACVFLMSDASAYMTGSAVSVDGGWTSW